MSESQHKLLCVDDELQILNALRRCLRKEPYSLYTASSGKEAIELLAKENIQVVVTDFRMPEMNGLELAQFIKTKYPDIQIIILSGYTDTNTMNDNLILNLAKEGFHYIFKPWDDEKLKAELKEFFSSVKTG